MRDGDIYRWSYNAAALKKRLDGNNGGTTYWCCSNIGVFDASKGFLVDTYWSSGDNVRFNSDRVKEELELKFIANMDDLEPVRSRLVFNYYDSEDCVDISHPNKMRGGFFIRKNAEKSINKMRQVLEAQISHCESKTNHYKDEVKRLKQDLSDLSIDKMLIL